MTNSSPSAPLSVVRSAAVISLGLVALAGSVAVVLCRRLLTSPANADPTASQVSKLVIDEWEADLARLNLPSRREVEALQRQLAELEAQIDQLIQREAQPKEEE